MKTFSKHIVFICTLTLLASGAIRCDQPIKINEAIQTYLDAKKELAEEVTKIKKAKENLGKKEIKNLENNLKKIFYRCINASKDSHEKYECKKLKKEGLMLIKKIKDNFPKHKNGKK